MSNRTTSGIALMVLVAILGACGFFGNPALPEIHRAAKAGDVAKLTELLDQEPHLVNAMERADWTPLHFAATSGHQEAAELLLARGANVHARLKYGGGTPLHAAATHGQVAMVSLLLANSASANAPDHNENTPLHRAALKGNREVAELLLAKGANPHAWSDTSFTPIDQAIASRHAEFADLLRERGRATLPIADDFSGDCHWSTGENERMSFGCDQGAYRLELKKRGPYHIDRNFGWGTPAVSVEVNVSVASGRGLEEGGGALLGIGCLGDRWHGYLGILKTNGAWAIMRIEKDFTKLAGTIAGADDEHAMADRHGNTAGTITGLAGTNRLRIVCARDSGEATLVSFFVNGRRIGSVKDEPGYARFNGVVLYADSFPGDVVFERFVAREP